MPATGATPTSADGFHLERAHDLEDADQDRPESDTYRTDGDLGPEGHGGEHDTMPPISHHTRRDDPRRSPDHLDEARRRIDTSHAERRHHRSTR